MSAVLNNTPTTSSQSSTQALDDIVESFIESFRYFQSSLLEESAIRNQITFLENHGFINADLPNVIKDLRLLKETIPIKMSKELQSGSTGSEELLSNLAHSVFTLISKMKQCLSHSLRNPVITFIDFQVGDVALFMPLHHDNRKIWIAFNSSSPYHFLSEVS